MSKRILVTGATGFLGGGVARRLTREGHDVLATGRNTQAGQELTKDGVAFQAADLSQGEQARALCKERDIVIHCAALSSLWGPLQSFRAANVDATRHIIEGCEQFEVGRLVHISSPSIYCSGEDQVNIDEDYPVTPTPFNYYIQTKIEAEEVVNASKVPAVTLRPRALFGPGDPSILPRLIDRMSQGKLPIVGDGKNVVDITYIDNVVHATCLAALHPDDNVIGRAYNITNGQGVELWSLLNRLALELGLKPPSKKLPYGFLYFVAGMLERLHTWFRPSVEPRLTRYGVVVLARNITLNIERARRDFGYEPIVTVEEGVSRYLSWRKEQGL